MRGSPTRKLDVDEGHNVSDGRDGKGSAEVRIVGRGPLGGLRMGSSIDVDGDRRIVCSQGVAGGIQEMAFRTRCRFSIPP
jgi:hypothetical protein